MKLGATRAVGEGEVQHLVHSIATGSLDGTQVITHRMTLAETEAGYDTFLRSAESGTLKVVLNN